MGSFNFKSVLITAAKVYEGKLVIEIKRTVKIFLRVYPVLSRNTKISRSNVLTFGRKCTLVSSDNGLESKLFSQNRMMFTVGMSFPRSCPARRKITSSGWFLFKLLFRASWACGGMGTMHL